MSVGPVAQRPGARLLALGWPLIVSFWLRQAFTWVDRIYATQLEGVDAAQAAIGLAVPFEFLMIALWVGSSNALTALLSEAIGAGDDRRVEELLATARRLVGVLVILFVAFAAGIWVLAERVGLDPDVARTFRIYATVLVGGSAFTMFWSILPDSVVKAHHDTKTTMWSGIASSVTNVLLNTLFLFVFRWGIFGIALSTVLGRLAGLAYAQLRAARHEAARRARAAGREPEPGRTWPLALGALLAIGIPSSLTYVLMALEGFLLNGILANAQDSTARLAGYGIFDSALRFLIMPPIALGVALLPLASRLRGQARLAELPGEVRVGLISVFAYSLVFVWPVAWLAAEPLAAALLSDPAAQEIAVLGLRWVPAAALLVGLVFFQRPLFDALGAPRRGLVLSAVRSLGCLVPGAFIGERLASARGLDPMGGMYAGLVVGMVVGAALFLVDARHRLRRAANA